MEQSQLRWGGFEKAKGWDGLNNAAINSFNSDIINSFVREMFQNSNDARQKDDLGNRKKLKIEIAYKNISVNDFPEYESFLNIITSMSAAPENSDHLQFFNQALSEFGKDGIIPAFIYKDFNTTGLEGSDDDASSTFSACVLSEGVTVKGDKTAGGSYGIGKNSIYGFSKLRTILYSSLNLGNEKIFQGLSKLASYKKNGKTYDYRTFFGKGDKLNSIRDFNVLQSNIQKLIDREEPGLTQIALCPIRSVDWMKDFTKAILRNYWLLIDDDQLEVDLSDNDATIKNISKSNLASLMLEYFDPETYNPEVSNQGNPFDFYACYKNIEPETRNVHMLGEMKFYYQELQHKKTNSVAFIRNGMMIFSEPIWGFGSIGYCGVIICNNKDGNSLLRLMEPPTHDKFDPSRLNERGLNNNESDGRKALEQTRKLIRDCLNKISDKYRTKTEEIPWLSNLLSSIKGLKGTGKGNRTGEASDKETIDRVSTEKKHTLTFDSVSRNTYTVTESGEIPIPGVTPPLPTQPEPPSPPKPPTPPGPPIPVRPKPLKNAAKINSRIFKTQQINSTNQYKILLKSDMNIRGKTLKLFQVGDSGNSACFKILEIKDCNNNEIDFEEMFSKTHEVIAYKIKNLSLPNELSLVIDEPYKSAFKLQEL